VKYRKYRGDERDSGCRCNGSGGNRAVSRRTTAEAVAAMAGPGSMNRVPGKYTIYQVLCMLIKAARGELA